MHNEELYNLYSSSSIKQMIKWRVRYMRHVEHMGRSEIIAISFCEHQEKRLLQRPRNVSRGNIKTPLTEAGSKKTISLNWLRIEPNDEHL
jgi:hypothetical protein